MKTEHQKLLKELGATIALYRQKANLTQEQVAELLGIGNEAVSRIERGVAIPNVLRLMELAEIFNCQVTDLLVRNSERRLDQQDYLLTMLNSLNSEQRKLAIVLIEQLVNHFRENPDNR